MTNSETIVAAAENILVAMRAGNYFIESDIDNINNRVLSEFEAIEATAKCMYEGNQRPRIRPSRMGGYIIKK